MDLEKIKIIVEEAINNANLFNWWFYVLILAMPAIGSFLGSYLKKKAENVATKEDIEEITKKIEDIRVRYNEQLESHKASLQLSNQLKLAALDKRLQKHQEAFTLWRELYFSLFNKNTDKTVRECQEWWNKNCLYLGNDARAAFYKAFSLAVGFKNIPMDETKERRVDINQIKKAGDKILGGVSLLSLVDETKDLETDFNKKS